ncbi:MAG: hypothetical protein U0401_31595 [Anaerolineae bacterium]
MAGQALGIAIATMAHLFDIDFYIIGGSVAQAGDLLLQPTREAVRYRAFEFIGSRATGLPALWAIRRHPRLRLGGSVRKTDFIGTLCENL